MVSGRVVGPTPETDPTARGERKWHKGQGGSTYTTTASDRAVTQWGHQLMIRLPL